MECLDNFTIPRQTENESLTNGETPRFEFSYDKISERSQRLSSFCRDNEIELFFAVKSCSEDEFLKIISEYVNGFDCSNLNEYNSIKKYNKKISFYNPIGGPDFFNKIQNISCDLIIEDQVDVKPQGMKIIRVNPTLEYIDKTPSRFGIPINKISNYSDINGIHFHLRELSEYKSEDFIDIIKKCLDKLPHIKFVNLGGGWHKLEKNNESYETLKKIRNAFPNLALRIEPGRYFTYECGKITGKIHRVDKEKKQILTNISSYLHLNWCDPKIKFQDQLNNDEYLKIQLVGPTCFEFDSLGSYLVPMSWWKKLKPGSEITLEGISSYTLQRQSEFNGISKAKFSIYRESFANKDTSL